MPAKKHNFKQAATHKGFIEIKNRDHIYYKYTNDGKIIDRISTKVSHGGGEDIPDKLLSKMTHQMKFDKKEDLEKFIKCTFTAEQYAAHLRRKGLIQ